MTTEQRGEPRIAHEIKFFVHVHECKDDPDMVGVSVECEAIDVSTRGMQFRSNGKLLSRSVLSITIGVGEPFAMYELKGEVRWVRSNGDHHYMGILLHEDEDSDYKKWEKDFTETFE